MRVHGRPHLSGGIIDNEDGEARSFVHGILKALTVVFLEFLESWCCNGLLNLKALKVLKATLFHVSS